MSDISLILLGAGSSSRFRRGNNSVYPKKQWLYSDNKPIWLQVVETFEDIYNFKQIMIVSSQEDISYMANFVTHKLVVGGSSRQESLRNAMNNIKTEFVLVSDIARCCIDKDMIDRVINARDDGDCVIPVLNSVDSVYFENKPVNRDNIKLVQTPQLSRTKILKKALSSDIEFSDDSSAIAHIGGNIKFVDGSLNAHKLTTINDIKSIKCINPPSTNQLIGFGVDIHPFIKDKKMYLCGVEIDSVDYGFKAHSDGDVAIHAIIDSLLGASGMGDIGELYPDNDNSYSNIDSKILLQDTVDKIRSVGFDIINVDITILAQAPRLLNYKAQMKEVISSILGIERRFVNIKATTGERLGFVGREEGVMVEAVSALKYFDWTKIK
ncbi:2-C-methyl-D-erythritol 4-phosphate cytidylyltransferase / 2-C-methyl-D-erythritol 2,4-cyclodiphosphate synthase [hydrothermal vent metagenome]|uniref:2-C-methyl-D-erythritol 2,4-cyclodiphosphate synthase n=1 Tax=hydrothermal vent metagenome TaxID=652676 RepID=A0A1W1EJ91_9ZZZZ